MHLAGDDHLTLGGVPQLVVRLALLQLLERIIKSPLVVRMFSHRLVHPVRQSGERIVFVIKPGHVVRQLAADDEFF